MSDTLQFLDGEPPAEIDTPMAAAGGSAPPAAAQAPDPSASVGPRAADAGQIPISALLDEREKRQAERARAETLERELQAMRAAHSPSAPLNREEAMEVALYSQNLRACRRFAEREYGKDAIDEVHRWATRRCDEDPHFNQQMLASDDPYEAAYQALAREKILAAVKPDDLAAFKAWQGAQARSGSHALSHSPVLARLAPRSLATASGTGGVGASPMPMGPGHAFASAIPRSPIR
jgi:hypothetical protein